MLIPATVFKGVSKLASKDPARYQLNGVRIFRNGKPHVEATDGKVLARVTWEEEDQTEFPDDLAKEPKNESFSSLIPARECMEIAKSAPKKAFRPILEQVLMSENGPESKQTFVTTDLEVRNCREVREIDGDYPKVDNPLERFEQQETVKVQVDLHYLKKLIEALQEIHGKKEKDCIATFEVPTDEADKFVGISVKKDGVETRGIICTIGEK